ncbi:MAG: DUF177 domain-containing protein [Burkholderiaceae bacterium]
MSGRATDPRRLDVAALAAAEATLDGHWPLSGFARLPEAHAQEGNVDWSLQSTLRRTAGGRAEPWLALTVGARVRLACQRCLQDVDVPLRIEANFRFVADEALAAALDAEAEEDVLALPQRLDLHELVEDELLLALPLVPMHETCLQPLLADDEPARAHPFAALEALKRH